MKHKTWVEISSQALSSNVKALRSILKPDVTFCAVVKANAYGHDLETIVRLLGTEGIDHFAVDSVDEAILIRQKNPQARIFVLGYSPLERAEEIVRHDLIQVIYNPELLDELSKIATKLQTKAKINLKIETGTQRQGIAPKKFDGFLREIRRKERSVELVSLSSHLANAEDIKSPFTKIQLNNFEESLLEAHRLGFDPEYQHLACSAAAIHNPDTQGTLVRFGIALYGLWPSEDLKRSNLVSPAAIELIPVLSFKTQIAQIKDIPAGTPIGYDGTFRPDRPIRIALLPVGYYDGYPRLLSNNSEVLINGQICRLVGAVCMNMIMVDISTIPNAQVGDTVTLLGRDGMNSITAESLAEKLGTINYEVTTQINPLLRRLVV